MRLMSDRASRVPFVCPDRPSGSADGISPPAALHSTHTHAIRGNEKNQTTRHKTDQRTQSNPPIPPPPPPPLLLSVAVCYPVVVLPLLAGRSATMAHREDKSFTVQSRVRTKTATTTQIHREQQEVIAYWGRSVPISRHLFSMFFLPPPLLPSHLLLRPVRLLW